MGFLKRFVVIIAVAVFAPAKGAGAQNNFTPEETRALELLRPQVDPLLNQDFMKRDVYLKRFLRAEEMNVERAKRRLEQTIRWRKAENIDNIVNEDFRQAEKCIHVHWLGSDRAGRPLLFAPFGTWDIRRCVLAGLSPQLNRFMTYVWLESTERRIVNATDANGDKTVAGSNALVDLNLFNIRTVGCLRCFQIVTNYAVVLERHYPGIFEKMSLINVPTIFDSFLSVIRSLLTKENAKLLKSYGANRDEWLPVLKRDIDLDILPVALGGKRRFP